MIMDSTDLRASARALPNEERERRRIHALGVSDHRLLTCVVAAGIGGGEWRSSSDCAARAFAIDDRSFRAWLANDQLVLSAAVRDKLRRLAWAFGVDFSHG